MMTPADTLRQSALDYLATHTVMTVATHGPEGLWAAAVFYASEDFTLYFLSAPHTRHSANIHAQSRVAATIQTETATWRDITGIQLEGQAALLDGPDAEHAQAVYSAKFPFITQEDGPESDIARALDHIRWYCIVPERLYLIDNSQGLGHRDEISLD